MFFITKLTKRWCYVLDTEDWVIEKVDKTTIRNIENVYGATLKCGEDGALCIYSNREIANEQILRLKLYSHVDIEAYHGMVLIFYTSQQESIRVPYGLTGIAPYAFRGCVDTVRRIAVPDTVKEINEGAFADCMYLRDVSLPDSIGTLSRSAFYKCKSLRHIDLPISLKHISGFAFSLSGLLSIQLPCNLKTIGVDAFSMCYALKEVVLPESIECIGDSAFSDCAFLEKIVIPSKWVTFGVNVFSHSPNVVIYTVAGSTAVTYAAKHKIPVIYI